MSELRWTLLILGVVFIGALAWWERRRPRQAWAPRTREAGGERADAAGALTRVGPGPAAERAGGAEPWIGETELSEVVLSDVALTDLAAAGAAAAREMHAQPSLLSPLADLPTVVIADTTDSIPMQDLAEPDELGEAMPAAETAPLQALEPMSAVEPEPAAADLRRSRGEADPAWGEHPVGDDRGAAETVGAVRITEPAAPAAPLERAPALEPIVEWPPEESRRILALRLLAPQPERFPGRTLRLALAAEGFQLGKFSIFHKPDEAHRAVLSAASLSRPGAFDLETMDSQRYAGLSLFAVLPGPKAPRQAFDELLAAARNLNERLQGALQDEQGGPLTPLRVAAIRESLRAEAPAGPATGAHET